MVDFYGKCRQIYNRPMDAMGYIYLPWLVPTFVEGFMYSFIHFRPGLGWLGVKSRDLTAGLSRALLAVTGKVHTSCLKKRTGNLCEDRDSNIFIHKKKH